MIHIDKHVALNIDSVQALVPIMMEYQPDLIVTDPPYDGMDIKGGGVAKNVSVFKDFENKNLTHFDSALFMRDLEIGFSEIKKPFNAYVFGNRFLMRKLINLAEQDGLSWDVLIFVKDTVPPFNGGHYLVDKEYCVYMREPGATFNQNEALKRYATVREMINFPRGYKPTTTPKHPAILIPMITISSKPSDVILDPFAGSFNTGIAAHLINRRSVLIEENEDEFVNGVKRLRNYVYSSQ
jgi:DNA modification methylase